MNTSRSQSFPCPEFDNVNSNSGCRFVFLAKDFTIVVSLLSFFGKVNNPFIVKATPFSRRFYLLSAQEVSELFSHLKRQRGHCRHLHRKSVQFTSLRRKPVPKSIYRWYTIVGKRGYCCLLYQKAVFGANGFHKCLELNVKCPVSPCPNACGNACHHHNSELIFSLLHKFLVQYITFLCKPKTVSMQARNMYKRLVSSEREKNTFKNTDKNCCFFTTWKSLVYCV